jgi:hypothetical protein
MTNDQKLQVIIDSLKRDPSQIPRIFTELDCMTLTESGMMSEPELEPIIREVINFTARVTMDHFMDVYGALIGHAWIDPEDPVIKRGIVESAVEKIINELQERGVDSIFTEIKSTINNESY